MNNQNGKRACRFMWHPRSSSLDAGTRATRVAQCRGGCQDDPRHALCDAASRRRLAPRHRRGRRRRDVRAEVPGRGSGRAGADRGAAVRGDRADAGPAGAGARLRRPRSGARPHRAGPRDLRADPRERRPEPGPRLPAGIGHATTRGPAPDDRTSRRGSSGSTRTSPTSIGPPATRTC